MLKKHSHLNNPHYRFAVKVIFNQITTIYMLYAVTAAEILSAIGRPSFNLEMQLEKLKFEIFIWSE